MTWLTKAVSAVLNMRSFRVSDPASLQYFGGSADSYSGKLVTVNGAMQISTVWACINLLANTIAMLPLQALQRDAKGYTSVDTTDPLYSLLHDQPNADMTAYEFWRAMIMNLMAHGNAYAEIVRTTRRVVALNPMRPELMGVRRAVDGSLLYTYAAYGGDPRQIAQENIMHLKGASFDGIIGLSPISFARHTLGLTMAADEAAGRSLKNGMRPSGQFTVPTFLTPANRALAETMMEKYIGAQNAGKVPLLEGGWDFKSISLPPIDLQLMETRSFNVEDICRWYSIPPHMVGHMDNATSWGSGLEQQNLGFLVYVLDAQLRSIEQATFRALVAPGDRANKAIRFDRDALLRADSAGRALMISTHAQNGTRTRDELRAMDNLPPLPGGDILTVQVNLTPLEKLANPPPPPKQIILPPNALPPSPLPPPATPPVEVPKP